jgi:hypothetical protein
MKSFAPFVARRDVDFKRVCNATCR